MKCLLPGDAQRLLSTLANLQHAETALTRLAVEAALGGRPAASALNSPSGQLRSALELLSRLQ